MSIEGLVGHLILPTRLSYLQSESWMTDLRRLQPRLGLFD